MCDLSKSVYMEMRGGVWVAVCCACGDVLAEAPKFKLALVGVRQIGRRVVAVRRGAFTP